MLQVDN